MTGFISEPSRPASEVPCEWCREPSVKAIRHHKRRGTFIYACRAHLHVAEQMNTPKERGS